VAKYKAKRRRARRTSALRRRGKRAFTLPLAVLAGLAPGIGQLWKAKSYGFSQVANVACRNYVGYDPDSGRMTGAFLGYGLLPMLAGFLVHTLAGKVGVNRALGRAGIPVFRL